MIDPNVLAGTYEIREQIGSGGGGVVYKAWHTRLQMDVVLKSLKAGTAATLETQRAEVDILKNLKHPFLPQVYDFIVDGDQVYTVMEYIQGENFDALLKRGNRFPQDLVVKWTGQLCEALSYLHSQTPPILHSDVKPANVMLTPQGDICLIDFNISLLLGDDGAVAVGQSHGYASPEQYGPDGFPSALEVTDVLGSAVTQLPETELLSPSSVEPTVLLSQQSAPPSRKTTLPSLRRLDKRSDVYSLGATVYHLLTGERPAVKVADVTPLASLGNYGEGIVKIVSKAMAPDPNHRFQDAGEMLATVRKIHTLDRRWNRQILQKRITIVSLIILLVVFSIGTFLAQRQLELKSQSYALAGYSAKALEYGDPEAAALLALEALPSNPNRPERPLVSLAEKSLADALGVYNVSDGFKPYKTIQLPSAPQKIVLSPGEHYAAIVYPHEIRIIDPLTTQTVETLPTIASALATMAFLDDSTLLYTGVEGITAFNLSNKTELWTSKPATSFAISGDGSTLATIFKNDREAIIYTKDGAQLATISFGEKHQFTPANDSFANPNNNLLTLNQDGTKVAISFRDGSLSIFDTNGSAEPLEILPPSPSIHFEGGFTGDYFSFSATEEGGVRSVFATISLDDLTQTIGFQGDNKFGVLADETGIYLSQDNLLVSLSPQTGKQQALASIGGTITGIVRNKDEFLLSADDESYYLVTDTVTGYPSAYTCHSLALGETLGMTGGLDSSTVTLLQKKEYSAQDFLNFDQNYAFDEARIKADESRILLFQFDSFYLLDAEGSLLTQATLPDADFVLDQQYDQVSGNLAVIYEDALRIYDGNDGKLLLEETDLQSTYFSSDGISILTQDGLVQLLSIGTAKAVDTAQSTGSFAAICGDGLLQGEKNSLEYLSSSGDMQSLIPGALIGNYTAKNGDIFFVIAGENEGAVYSVSQGVCKLVFTFSAESMSEAYFAKDGAAVVISPLHGIPVVYDLNTGKSIRELEKDGYLTAISELPSHIVGEYISAAGQRYALLLDPKTFEPLAHVPHFMDAIDGELILNSNLGILRKVSVQSLPQLMAAATEQLKGKVLTPQQREIYRTK